jgi:hypothetical protein
MATQEERLESVEFNLRQFKTETIKAYGDMAYEIVIVKGLGEDSIKRLATVSRQIESMDGRLSTIEQSLETMKAHVDQRFNAIETLLTQILARLPDKHE